MTECPYCLRKNDTHAPTEPDHVPPSEGDVSICWKCHNLGIFREDGTVRKTSPEEDADLRSHDNIRDALMVMGKAVTPTAAADILRHAQEWEASHLQTETGIEDA